MGPMRGDSKRGEAPEGHGPDGPRTRRTSRRPGPRHSPCRWRDNGQQCDRDVRNGAACHLYGPSAHPACGRWPGGGTAGATSPPSVWSAHHTTEACDCWNCQARGGAPAQQCARPEQQSQHHDPRGPPSKQRPDGPMTQDRQSFPTRNPGPVCCLSPRLLPSWGPNLWGHNTQCQMRHNGQGVPTRKEPE